ncbi:hypothetical protein FNU76_01100 [Chitinimonas arctica]|uniref:Uncharacterized protein n=1 Tax=Chitinimonas arctica TaxID=2594795 RepID=A0A516SA90_9NEIS|nr:hypothetical protein [Chitinimonas arctica]QDQ25057.1 hypothetical protein FNU76_01100 [Chitinimonas arctica]
MDVLELLGNLTSVRVTGTSGARLLLDVAGAAGWIWIVEERAGIAVQIDVNNVSDAWLRKTSLLLGAGDDTEEFCLILDGGKVWLYRTYSLAMTPVEWEANLGLLMTVAHFLANNAARKIERAVVGGVGRLA